MTNPSTASRTTRPVPFSWPHLEPFVRAFAFCVLALGGLQAMAQQAPAVPPLPIGAESLPDIVAKVNGDPITKSELLNQAQSMRQQSLGVGSPDPAQSADFLRFVLDALIGERLVFIDVESRDLGPTDGEVDDQLAAVIRTYGGEASFDQALARQGVDRSYVRKQIRQSLAIDKVMDGEIKPDIQISEDQIKAYYDRQGSSLILPASYRLRHILKTVPQGTDTAAKQAARAQLESVRGQLVAGGDFAALAKEHSDDAGTKEKGGEMPWIVFSGFEKSFEDAVSQLEIGELSGVVETRIGLHLLELLEVRSQRPKTLDEARPEINQVLSTQAARAAIQRRVEQLRAAASVEILM